QRAKPQWNRLIATPDGASPGPGVPPDPGFGFRGALTLASGFHGNPGGSLAITQVPRRVAPTTGAQAGTLRSALSRRALRGRGAGAAPDERAQPPPRARCLVGTPPGRSAAPAHGPARAGKKAPSSRRIALRRPERQRSARERRGRSRRSPSPVRPPAPAQSPAGHRPWPPGA